MLTTNTMSCAAQSDAELVHATLDGNRDAFGQIVARYQSLICSLAYSATGSLGNSEDLAQETFITAWKHLGRLRERHHLRAWLCGIARNRIHNFLRREGRQPNYRAESIEEIPDSHSPEPLPTDYAISQEEQAILWRSLERIPDIYREPLVLFYREHQSIETVAADLNLSADAVKQRLSRGRRLLQEQVLAFVEGALSRTNPGKAFTLAVVGALPATLMTSAKAATLAATAAKAGATAKGAGLMGLLGILLSPLMILFGNYIPYRIGLAGARSETERGQVMSFFRKACVITLGSFVPLAALTLWLGKSHFSTGDFVSVLFCELVLIYLFTIIPLSIITARGRREYFSQVLAREYDGVFPKTAWEYCSKVKFLGLPLVHIRIGDRFGFMKNPVKAWIAVAHYAVGGFFAFGAVAIAPFSIGGLTVGLVSLGGVVLGVFPFGGLSVGVFAFGGLAIGWQAFGCGALAWNAAAGNFALAHNFALGNVTHAAQAETAAARQFIESNTYFRSVEFVSRHWYWVNLLWITPLLIQWWLVARKKIASDGTAS